MVLIPAGDFMRGRTHDWPDQRLKWYPNPLKDDLPVGPIVLRAFHLDAAEVSNERYAAFVEAAGRRPPFHWIDGLVPEGTERHPVTNVDWRDAAAFCAWEGKRLPTEAEWEKACRGGLENKMYPWGDEPPTEAEARFGAADGPIDVCSKKRSAVGLCDIVGNVWEWTADWYDRDYYAEAPEEDPPGPQAGQYRVIRGGSWFDKPESMFLTCSYRSWARPSEKSPNIGFRCAKSVASDAVSSGP